MRTEGAAGSGAAEELSVSEDALSWWAWTLDDMGGKASSCLDVSLWKHGSWGEFVF